MFDEIQYRWTVRGIRKRKAHSMILHRRKMKEARAKGATPFDMSEHRDAERQDLREYQDWIAVIQTRHLISQADKLQLPTPNRTEEPEKWVETWDFDYYLTVSAAAQLRAEIRNERKARQEIWHSRVMLAVSLIAAATGLLGAAIGLLAYLAKQHAP